MATSPTQARSEDRKIVKLLEKIERMKAKTPVSPQPVKKPNLLAS